MSIHNCIIITALLICEYENCKAVHFVILVYK